MKYEAVFGDYKFSSPACEIAMQSSFGEIIEMRFTKPLVIPEGWGVIAMRRIIAEPKRWTVEDQKAGRLPEVGCRIYVPMMHEEQNVIYSSEKVIVSISDNGGAVTRTEVASINRINPIETPDEKAERLRSEWINKAYVDFHHLGCELEVLQKEQIKLIYDALLSGDLPVPVKGGE